MEKFNHQEVDKKWAAKWVKDGVFTPDLENAENPYYALFMFPYPSAEGLHIGNFYAFTNVDVMAKYKKLRGFDVFEPIGWDAFGMHSENYALKIKETPQKMLERTTANFANQLQAVGIGCDWTRLADTTKPEYYKWTQWIFLKLLELGLAEQKEALLNWCPACKTVLADEQIEEEVCERCKSVPEKKSMKQWFFRITKYAQRLLDGLNDMDWSEITKAAQRNWIGRSEGANVDFTIGESNVTVFTTRPDTLFGATYMVLAPEHELVKRITTEEQRQEVEDYVRTAGAKSDLERTESKEKTGVFTGAYAVNPVNGAEIPVWIADYVLMGYGTGAIMAVPAHDERDFEFARKYDLPIKEVVKGGDISKQAFCEEGEALNSDFLDGLRTAEAKNKMIEWLSAEGLGEGSVNFRLRDWCISRQRYWGPPVPVIHCEKCGTVPVPEEDLPVMLPEMTEGWEPAGDGKGPLSNVEEFMNVDCPECGGPGRREADVMDNFLDSAWYFYRYLSPHRDDVIFDDAIAKRWLPVDFYVGGNEHAVLHLMYTRFITMGLHDLGLIDFDNPFKRFRANGMLLKDGKKMSKSKGNVVNPEEYGEKVGYDALKTYILFLGPLSEDRSFSDEGIQGTRRWIEKVARLEKKVVDSFDDSEEVLRKLHKTIKAVGDDFESQKYNTAVAKLMELTNELASAEAISVETWKKLLILCAPFTPALAEEMWERQGSSSSIFDSNWPVYDEKLMADNFVKLAVQVNGKLRGEVEVSADAPQDFIIEMARSDENVARYLEAGEVVKEIYVPDRLVSFVVK